MTAQAPQKAPLNHWTEEQRVFLEDLWKYYPKLLSTLVNSFGYTFRVYSIDAESIVQDAFFKAGKYSANFKGGSNKYTWLFRIAVNEALQAIRNAKRRIVTLSYDDNLDDRYDSLEKPLTVSFIKGDYFRENQDDLVFINECLQFFERYGLDMRKIIEMKIEGYYDEEISEVLKINVETVRVRFFRSKVVLKRFLSGRRDVRAGIRKPMRKKTKVVGGDI